VVSVRVIIDTDPGIDDAHAILYLAAAPEVEIVAIGSAHGNVSSAQSAANALCVLAQAGRTEVPVAIGAARPLAQPVETAEFIHGHDGLAGVSTPTPGVEPVGESAAAQIVRLARANPGELTVLALAPLTNLALAYLLEPELPTLLRSVVVMGGALAVPGNITPFAEANIWHDPEAADLVFDAGFDLTLAALDVTGLASADRSWLAMLANIDDGRARFATTLLKHYTEVYTTLFGHEACTLHDPLAAAIAVDPGLATYADYRLAVELGRGATRGQLLADRRGMTDEQLNNPIGTARRPARVALSADVPVFFDRLLAAFRP
jgi:purine nucleosidase